MSQVSQVKIVGAILKALGKTATINQRQMNAVIAAADGVVAAMAQEHAPATPGMGLAAWVASDDTGESSLYMAGVLGPYVGFGKASNLGHHGNAYPRDPSDFGRCVRLLDAAPELRQYLDRLEGVEHGPAWNAIAREWATLEAWYREDLYTGRSERLFEWLRNADGKARMGAA